MPPHQYHLKSETDEKVDKYVVSIFFLSLAEVEIDVKVGVLYGLFSSLFQVKMLYYFLYWDCAFWFVP